MSDMFDDDADEAYETEEIPREDIEAASEQRQPDTQGDDPEEAWLGADGQGDISPEDGLDPDAEDDEAGIPIEDLP